MKQIGLIGVCLGLVIGLGLGGAGVFVWLTRGDPPPAATHGAEAAGEQAGAHSETEAAHDHDASESAHEEHRLVLSDQAVKSAGIETTKAAGGEFQETRVLPGEIVLNADKVAHIVPRVAGIVRRVDKFLGDDVQPGEVMAVLESRELAEAKASYLAANERLVLATANLTSAQSLHEKKIMPDLEFLTIQKALAEVRIELRSAENKLHALGLSHEETARLSDRDADLATYELRVPFAGTIIQKHVALGEVLTDQSDAFILADLTAVWVNVTVYARDVSRISVGQAARIRAEGVTAEADGTITYISPVISEATRTATARVVLANTDRRWKPGMFVSAAVVVEKEPVRVLVPNDAVQTVEDRTVVFTHDGEAFEPRPVTVGRTNTTQSEIVKGLAPGEVYVVKGAFMLKAEIAKGSGGHQH